MGRVILAIKILAFIPLMCVSFVIACCFIIAMPFVGLAQIMLKGKADLDDYVYKAEEISFYFLDKFY